MKRILFLYLLLLSSLSFSSIELQKFIKAGDIILIELNCYSCRFVAEETNSPFSHVGFIIKDGSNYLVAEALGEVRALPLQQFLSRSPSGGQLAIMRHRELEQLNEDYLNQRLWELLTPYWGVLYDHFFSWNDEVLYCSEFIAKLFNQIVRTPFSPKPMDYSRHWSFWYQYFKGRVPQGEPGLSPHDFYIHQKLRRVYP